MVHYQTKKEIKKKKTQDFFVMEEKVVSVFKGKLSP